MVRHTAAIMTMTVFLVTVGFTSSAADKVETKPVVTETGKIRIPDLPVTPVKPATGFDLRALRVGQKNPEHAKAQIGPVEFEGRTLPGDAPWQPHQYQFEQWTPFFERWHTDFCWSFYLHWKPQN